MFDLVNRVHIAHFNWWYIDLVIYP